MRTRIGFPASPAKDPPLIYLSTQYIQAKEYLEAIFASSADAIITTDMHGRIMYFSPGAERMLKLPCAKAVGRPVSEVYRAGKEEALQVMSRLRKDGSLADYETQLKTETGDCVHVSMSASLLKDRSGILIGTLGISKDISRRVELERKLRELSITDNLTGLYNQRFCGERLKAEVERARRQGTPLSVIVIDLDDFKDANDSWGHLEGDRILKESADILRSCIRRHVDSAFRYGGDEFVVLLPGLGRRTAEKVARRVRKSAEGRDFSCIVTFSAGTAQLGPRDDAASLLRRADEEMYQAKRRAKRPRL